MKTRLSQDLKQYISNFETMADAAKKIDVSVPTLYALINDSREPSTEFVMKVKQNVGWDWEKAFTIKEDSHG